MKVVIPVVDKDSHKYSIAGGFNETSCLCVYDSLQNDLVWYDVASLSQNMNNLVPELKRRELVNVVTQGMQPMALNVLNNSGFTVYKAMGDSLMLNIELFNKECLPIFNMNLSFEGVKSCGGGCSSCGSSDCKN